MENYEEISAQIAKLKPYQKRKLEKFVSQLSVINSINQETILASEMECRKCGSGYFVKNGHSPGGAQRYKCKHCGCTQCIDANTPLYCLKYKDKWADFVFLMLDQDLRKTCDSIAEEIDVERKTAHAWRHKFASSVAKILPLK
jgi:transposase-like protein